MYDYLQIIQESLRMALLEHGNAKVLPGIFRNSQVSPARIVTFCHFLEADAWFWRGSDLLS